MDTTESRTPFIILGGGIAGLSAAIALQRIGIEAKVYEAAPEFKPIGAGITLAANAMKACRHLGIYEALCEAGNTTHRFTIYDQKGRVVNSTDTSGLGEGLHNLAIHRAVLHEVLLSKLDANQVVNGKKTEDFYPEGEGYRISFADGSSIRTKHLVVAEGIHSVARAKWLPQSRLRYAGYACWRGIADSSLEIGETSETWGTQGRFGIVPLGCNKVYWFACKKTVKDNVHYRSFQPNDLEGIFRGYHSPIGEVIRSTPADGILYNDILDLAPIHRFAFGNAVLIGDAAHATTPNMGQGACQAIEDAVVLAKCLRDHPVPRQAFKKFEKKRMQRTHDIVNRSWILGRVAQMENRLLAALRNTFLRNLPKRYYERELERIYDLPMGL